MSRIVEFTSYGGPEVLKFKDIPDPKPAANEIRIRVKAIGLNRAESMWRHGKYIEPVNLPARLGYEAAGTVDALGEGVLGFAIGDPVDVVPNFSMNEYATYGDPDRGAGQLGREATGFTLIRRGCVDLDDVCRSL
jgi:NADPH:quinone reductase-like Zn-dependent oxidoreductase